MEQEYEREQEQLAKWNIPILSQFIKSEISKCNGDHNKIISFLSVRPMYRLCELMSECAWGDQNAIDDFLYLADVGRRYRDSEISRDLFISGTVNAFRNIDQEVYRFREFIECIANETKENFLLELTSSICKKIRSRKNWKNLNHACDLFKLSRILERDKGKNIGRVDASIVRVFYHARDWLGFFRLLELQNAGAPIEKFQGIGMRKYQEKLNHLREELSFYISVGYLSGVIISFC